MRRLSLLAQQKLTDNMIAKVKDGQYTWQAKAGKKLVPFMSDWVIFDSFTTPFHHRNAHRSPPCSVLLTFRHG